jgi:hypothetical protein
LDGFAGIQEVKKAFTAYFHRQFRAAEDVDKVVREAGIEYAAKAQEEEDAN